MVHFADNRPEPGAPIVDATEFTFFSGMSNIDFELQDGNPAAIAVRFHVAQHSELTHMNFRIGTARAAVEDIGNQASDIHVEGGEYGIITKRTAPVWQFLLMDSSFDGQRAAAIKTQEAGFTLIRVSFSNMPVALQIAPGEVEQLYGRDLRMENIRDAAFVAGNARNPHSEVTLVNIACSDVPRFFHHAIKAPGRHYVVDRFSLGLMIGADGREEGIAMSHQERALAKPAPEVPTDIPPTPAMDNWANVHSLGVTGDGKTDDTDALLAAIEKHAVLFFPSGTYRVSRPLTLKPDTALIGLNPGTTRISLIDGSPAFGGEGSPVGIIVAPKGGRNIVRSIAITHGQLESAGGCSDLDGWKEFVAGRCFLSRSAVLRFGRSRVRWAPTSGGGAPAVRPAFESSPAAADLLITNGGGGIFRNNWLHGTNAKIGLRVENTETPGRSTRCRSSITCGWRRSSTMCASWEIYAFQTEEENPAGADAYAHRTSKTPRACCLPTLTCIGCRATCCPRPMRSSRVAPMASLSKT